jgi:hypothetical protein
METRALYSLQIVVGNLSTGISISVEQVAMQIAMEM